MGFFADPETLHFIKVFSSAILAIVFGILCFSLFRLNKHLKRTIESREAAELTRPSRRRPGGHGHRVGRHRA